MRNYTRPHKPRNDLVPVRTSRVLFDATQRQRPQPYFGRGVAMSAYTPYHAAPVPISDLIWYAAQNGRRAEQEWDSDTVAEARATEASEIAAAHLDRYASALAL